MPLLSGADFQPRKRYRNGHYSTFVPYILGKTPRVLYERERIETPDGDFIDLDFSRKGFHRLVVLAHGLEGSSRSGYVLLFADHFFQQGWDIMSLNYRGCSGTINRSLQMYNSGTTEDIDLALRYISGEYEEIVLIGFSLGGNLILKYLGEGKFNISPKISSAVAISTPVHLADASKALLNWDNILYQWKFLISLSTKIWKKKKQFPDDVELRHLLKCTNLYKFDDYYTAPLFGYQNADDYYAQNQSIQWLDQIKVPSLIINSLDDPFLGPGCYPEALVQGLEYVHLCTPEFGGHVGFAYSRNDRSWLFEKISGFINN